MAHPKIPAGCAPRTVGIWTQGAGGSGMYYGNTTIGFGGGGGYGYNYEWSLGPTGPTGATGVMGPASWYGATGDDEEPEDVYPGATGDDEDEPEMAPPKEGPVGSEYTQEEMDEARAEILNSPGEERAF